MSSVGIWVATSLLWGSSVDGAQEDRVPLLVRGQERQVATVGRPARRSLYAGQLNPGHGLAAVDRLDVDPLFS